MFKGLQAGLGKFFSKKWIPILVILIICFILMFYSSNKALVLDKMTDFGSGMGALPSAPSAPMAPSGPAGPARAAVAPSGPAAAGPIMPSAVGPSGPAAASASASSVGASGYSKQAVANPSELLPVDKNSQWATLNPSGNTIPLPDLLQAGQHIGLDTIGQTLKNANYQLRSDPIIEKKEIGPWMQSTIEPDFGRVPLEVGYGQR